MKEPGADVAATKSHFQEETQERLSALEEEHGVRVWQETGAPEKHSDLLTCFRGN